MPDCDGASTGLRRQGVGSLWLLRGMAMEAFVTPKTPDPVLKISPQTLDVGTRTCVQFVKAEKGRLAVFPEKMRVFLHEVSHV